MLAAVGERAELREPEEAAVALDGVDGAKDARERLEILRPLLEREEVAVDLIEVLRRFDEELLDELSVVAHPRWVHVGHPARRRRCAGDPAGRSDDGYPEAYTRKTAHRRTYVRGPIDRADNAGGRCASRIGGRLQPAGRPVLIDKRTKGPLPSPSYGGLVSWMQRRSCSPLGKTPASAPLDARDALMTATRPLPVRAARLLVQAAALLLCTAVDPASRPVARASETSFKNALDQLEQLHQKAVEARDKRDFVAMEDARLRRQQLLQAAAEAGPFQRPPDFGKCSPAERLAIEADEAAYTRLVPWIDGHKAVVRSEQRTRKMQYAAAAKTLRDHWQKTYADAKDLRPGEFLLGDVGVALFRTCQAASYVHPDFLSRDGRSERPRADDDNDDNDDKEASAGLNEAELKAILRSCRLHDPCQVEVNLMLAFLERLTNDNAFLRAENRPELETRNKLLLDLADSTGSDEANLVWQPRLEFLKAQSTLFILDELKFYDTFLEPARLLSGNDHARRPFLVTETNDACLQVPTATTLRPMLAVRKGQQCEASSLYYVRVRKTNGDGKADTLWPLRDRNWPSSPAVLNLTANLETVYEDYLLTQVAPRFSERFFTSIGGDLVEADRVRDGVDHFRQQTKAGQVPTVADLPATQPPQPKATRLGVYASRIRSFVDQVNNAFRTAYLREHPEMQARVDAIMADLNENLKYLDAVKDRPQELTAALGGLSMDGTADVLGELSREQTTGSPRGSDGKPILSYAALLLRVQQYHRVLSAAIANIASERGIIELQRKEMASRVQTLSAKARQFAILKTIDLAVIAMAQAVPLMAQGSYRTDPTRAKPWDRVDLMLRSKKTSEKGTAVDLNDAEIAFLRDFRRIQSRVITLLDDIKRDCGLIHSKLSPDDANAVVALGAVEQTAQLLSSISHNLSQLAPAGLFDTITYAPPDAASSSDPRSTEARAAIQESIALWSAARSDAQIANWQINCFHNAGELAAGIGAIDALREDLQAWIDADRTRQQVDRYCQKFQGKRRTVETPLYTAEVIPIAFPYQFGELQDSFRHLPRLHLAQAADLRRLLDGKSPLGPDAIDFDRTYLSRSQASNISNVFVRAFDAKQQQWVVTTVNSPTDIDVLFLLAIPASPADQSWFDACFEGFSGGPLTAETWLGDRPARMADGSLVVDFDGLEGLIPLSQTSGDRYGRNRHWQSIRRVAADAIRRDASGGIAADARFFELVTRDRGATVTDRAVVYSREDWQQLDSNATNDFLPGMQSLAPSLPGAEILRDANARPIPTNGFRWLPICPPYAVGTP